MAPEHVGVEPARPLSLLPVRKAAHGIDADGRSDRARLSRRSVRAIEHQARVLELQQRDGRSARLPMSSPASRLRDAHRRAQGLAIDPRKKKPGVSRRQAERVLGVLYGIDFEDWARLFEGQSGRCAGCSNPLGHDAATHVDHCHKTGRVRGLLCSGCNHAVGKVRDSPDTLRRLADYLDRNTTPTQR